MGSSKVGPKAAGVDGHGVMDACGGDGREVEVARCRGDVGRGKHGMAPGCAAQVGQDVGSRADDDGGRGVARRGIGLPAYAEPFAPVWA